MNVPAVSLTEKINGLLGGDNHVYFVNSGSEANEAGFKIARQYMKPEHPGEFRYKTIGRYWAYHGTTLGTLAAGGMGERKAKFEPLGGNDFVHTAPPYCYVARSVSVTRPAAWPARRIWKRRSSAKDPRRSPRSSSNRS